MTDLISGYKYGDLKDIPKPTPEYLENIPLFKIMYKKITQPNCIITVCELRSLDDNTKLAYGMSSTKNIAGYSPVLGKKIAFAQACQYLFMQANGNKKLTEDDMIETIQKEKSNGNRVKNTSKNI